MPRYSGDGEALKKSVNHSYISKWNLNLKWLKLKCPWVSQAGGASLVHSQALTNEHYKVLPALLLVFLETVNHNFNTPSTVPTYLPSIYLST